MTLQDALVAYRTYARAEGKSPKTVAWVTSSVGYFSEFLGPEQQDIGAIIGNDLRRFIIALQSKPKFANHLYNKPQQTKLSAQSIETYCRAIRARKPGGPRVIPEEMEPVVVKLYGCGYGYRAIARILNNEYRLNPHYSSVRNVLVSLGKIRGTVKS